jgi:hypothetical protein
MSSNSASIGAKAPSLPHNRLALPANVSPRCFYTGGTAPQVSTDFTNVAPTITILYMAEIFVPASCAVTGIALFTGASVSGNGKVGLYDIAGTLLAVSASTALSSTDSIVKIPFASEFISSGAKTALANPLILTGGTYYIGVIADATGVNINTHTIGNFGAGTVTGLVYATAMDTLALNVAPPTTFTTAQGPVAALY